MGLKETIKTRLAEIPSSQKSYLTILAFIGMTDTIDYEALQKAAEELVVDGVLRKHAVHIEEDGTEYEIPDEDLPDIQRTGQFAHPETGMLHPEDELSYFYSANGE